MRHIGCVPAPTPLKSTLFFHGLVTPLYGLRLSRPLWSYANFFRRRSAPTPPYPLAMIPFPPLPLTNLCLFFPPLRPVLRHAYLISAFNADNRRRPPTGIYSHLFTNAGSCNTLFFYREEYFSLKIFVASDADCPLQMTVILF